ncbi:MAG: hypothetical protein LBO69_05870 [Ignavibacteria bacterium]|jgi:hypothetical protein|nr:hypothetical protein [Ignavibacteria bacterium]
MDKTAADNTTEDTNSGAFFDNLADFDKNEPIEPIESLVDDIPIDSDYIRQYNEELEKEHTGVIKAGDKEQFVESVDFSTFLNNANYKDGNPLIFEQLDEHNIINRGIQADYLVDDQLKIKLAEEEEAKKNRIEPFYIAKYELETLIHDNPGIKIFRKDENGNPVEYKPTDTDSPIPLDKDLDGLSDDELIEIGIPIGHKKIRTEKKPIADTNITNADDYTEINYDVDYDEDEEYITDEESERRSKEANLLKTLTGIQSIIDDINEQNEYKNPDELFKDFLQENFKDYLLAKKISGNNQVKFADKVVASENIKLDDEKVEITDLERNVDTTLHKTSVLINRNEDMEIDSIEVLCQCGERTVIKFDEVEDINITDAENSFNVDKTHTEVIVDTLNVSALNYAKEVNKSLKKEEEIVDEEIETLEEEEDDE